MVERLDGQTCDQLLDLNAVAAGRKVFVTQDRALIRGKIDWSFSETWLLWRSVQCELCLVNLMQPQTSPKNVDEAEYASD